MKPDFSKLNGLIPCIVQDAKSNLVLMLGFMNEEAWQITNESGRVTFWSRSKKALWTKGEESGNFLDVVSIKLDCDQDTALIRANPHGPVCHLNTVTCFNSEDEKEPTSVTGELAFLETLEKKIRQRKNSGAPNSYVSKLFADGRGRIAQKVGEEATEVVIASLGNPPDREEIINESADLLFHLMILLEGSGARFLDVVAELMRRAR